MGRLRCPRSSVARQLEGLQEVSLPRSWFRWSNRSLYLLPAIALYRFLCTGQLSENTCPGSEESRRHLSSYHVSNPIRPLRLLTERPTLTAWIADTGIADQRDAIKEKEATMTLKQKTRERVQPKMGKIDIDYQKLHDAFFRYQTKPSMSKFGEA